MKALFIIYAFLFLAFQFSSAQQKNTADSLISVANAYIFKNPEEAIKIGKKILETPNTSATDKISSYITIANGYSAMAEYENSIEYALKANSLANEIKDNVNQIRVLGFIGNQFIRLEMREEAWKYLDQADKLSQTVPLPDTMKYLAGNINLLKGLLYKRSLNCEYAIKHFNRAIAEFRKNRGNGYANVNLGQAYSQKGFCYLDINMDSAKISLTKGLEEAKKYGAKSLESNALLGISQVLMAESEFEQANDTLSRALQIAKETGQTEMEDQIYKELANNFLQLGNIKKHLFYDQLYQDYNQVVLKEGQESLNKILKNRTKKNTLESKKERKKFQITIAILSVLFALISVFFGLLIFRNKKKLDRIKSKIQ